MILLNIVFSGTFFWHGHYKLHYLNGLKGSLVIKPVHEMYRHDAEITVELSDWYHDSSADLLKFYLNGTLNPNGEEPVFNSGLINGQGYFDCSKTTKQCHHVLRPSFTVLEDSVTKVRVINEASLAGFLFSIDDHLLTIVEVDGVEVQPYTVKSFTINIAQRYS